MNEPTEAGPRRSYARYYGAQLLLAVLFVGLFLYMKALVLTVVCVAGISTGVTYFNRHEMPISEIEKFTLSVNGVLGKQLICLTFLAACVALVGTVYLLLLRLTSAFPEAIMAGLLCVLAFQASKGMVLAFRIMVSRTPDS